jgi:hypothetical protein
MQQVQRALGLPDELRGDVSVKGCGPRAGMAQQRLDNAQIRSCLQQVGREAVAERLNTLLIHLRRCEYATGIILFLIT